jgi:hypothetical protein
MDAAARGTGLWDNSVSVDSILRLIKLPTTGTTLHYLVAHGIKLWFAQSDMQEFARASDRKSREIIRLPKPLYDAFARVAGSPRSFPKTTRSEAHKAMLGDAADGIRIEALFNQPEVPEILAPLVTSLCARLDKAFNDQKMTLAKNPFTELGILLELTVIGIYPPADKVKAWHVVFDAANERTKDNREFFDAFVKRVRPIFNHLIKK